ncbi:MAG: ArsR/SmtB family transcription factor [Actinomycetota bacterium]
MTFESGPKVRDMTRGGRALAIEVDPGSVYELLLTAWTAFDVTENHDGFEVGADWFEEVAESTPAHVRAEMKELGGEKGGVWCALRGLVMLAPTPHDVEPVLDWIARLDPSEIRRGLLSYELVEPADPTRVDLAVEGDTEALGALLADKPEVLDHYARLFSLGRGELRDRLVAVLREFRSVLSQFTSEFAPAITRAAHDVRPMLKGADPERVIEAVTNGLDYRIRPGTTRLVLVPSVVARPWAVIDQYQDVLMVVYPVADEYLSADPGAPPSWLVKVNKALGDDKRLRILRRLAEGPTTLDELASLLEVTKSTAHHHVGLLRAAGLVRVAVDPTKGSKTYSFRPTVLPGAHQALDEYLDRPDPLQTARSER